MHTPLNPYVPRLRTLALLVGLGAGPWATPLWAQTATPADPVQNQVQLTATAQREVVHDWLTVTLVTRAQGQDAAVVQRQITQVLDQALATVRPHARPGAFEVGTGGFGVWPRYGKEGQVVGWQGSAQLVLQGRDAARLTQWAGQLPGLVVANLAWGLSTATAQRHEAEVRQEAIAQFRQTAQQIAQGFGFGAYRLREVSVVSDSGPGPARPRPVAMAMEARMASPDAAVPTEPGKGVVQVTLSGSVQLQ